MSCRIGSGMSIALFLTCMLIMSCNAQHIINAASLAQRKSINSIVLQFKFYPPVVTENSGHDSVVISGLSQYGLPGEPILPFKLAKVLIPQDSNVQRIDVTTSDRIVLRGKFNVAYGKTPIPISSNITVVDQPNRDIYNSANPFPPSLISQISEQYLGGFKILLFRLYPVQYIPKNSELSFFETIAVTIFLQETGKPSAMFRDLLKDKALVMDVVDNPEETEAYTKAALSQQNILLDPSESYDYVIITNNGLKSSFQPLIDWKIQNGLDATTVSVEDILKNPKYHSNGLFGDGTGSARFNDTQAHIRNFIKDAYLNLGIEYVLLGGDDEIIPARGVYCYAGPSWTDYDIPCDLYYGALDGSWDSDNDTIFGECVYHWSGPENGTAGEEADFFAEVYVGRATVDTPEEAMRFVNKTITYEKSLQNNYLKKTLMIGERLDNITEGGNAKDLTTEITPQYSTTRLYTRDKTFNPNTVINEMNNGVHIVNHNGHSNYRYVMGLSRSNVDNLTNIEYFMAYSMGCYSAAFDEATSGPGEAIGEHFIFSPNGAFAYIGNSRYGWYVPGFSEGPGERYDRSFFSVLMNGTRNLGKALQFSKEREPILDRWTYFTLTLFGDPETEIFTEIEAPTAHFETRADLLNPPRVGGLVNFMGTAKRGTAAETTFNNFTIEFGEGTNPTFWMTTGINLTNAGQSEVTKGKLCTWNTSQVPEGTYTLKLIVSDTNGLIGEDKRIVVVDQQAISIRIRSDGTVYPSTAPIQRNCDLYTLTNNIVSEDDGIIIERDNMTLNGAGYMIQGIEEGIGICLLERSNITIKNIEVRAHLYGIYLLKSSNCIISENNITDNKSHGLWLSESSNTSITRNKIIGNYAGISLLFSSNNNITENEIMANNGIYGGGTYFYASSGNSINHNTFIGNTHQVYDAAWDCANPDLIAESVNIWDNSYPYGGNFWSDYNPPDLYSGTYQNVTGKDKIGDLPYVIDRNNIDRYPLIYHYDYVPSPDLYADGLIDIFDIVIFAKAFGSIPGEPDWNPEADLIQDEIIDIFDFVVISFNFGKPA